MQMNVGTHSLPLKCAGVRTGDWGGAQSHRNHKLSRCLLVCSEEGRKGLLSSLVCICTEWHRLCTTPSLVWPGGFFRTLLWPTSTTQWMGGRVTLSVCVRALFSAPNWRTTAPVPARGLTITLNLFTYPHLPAPFYPTYLPTLPEVPLKHPLRAYLFVGLKATFLLWFDIWSHLQHDFF